MNYSSLHRTAIQRHWNNLASCSRSLKPLSNLEAGFSWYNFHLKIFKVSRSPPASALTDKGSNKLIYKNVHKKFINFKSNNGFHYAPHWANRSIVVAYLEVRWHLPWTIESEQKEWIANCSFFVCSLSLHFLFTFSSLSLHFLFDFSSVSPHSSPQLGQSKVLRNTFPVHFRGTY